MFLWSLHFEAYSINVNDLNKVTSNHTKWHCFWEYFPMINYHRYDFVFSRRSPDFSRVVGNWSCRRTYSTCQRWRYQPIGSGCVRQHVPRWSHVRTNKNLAPLAPSHQHQPETLRHLLCSCSDRYSRNRHVERFVDAFLSNAFVTIILLLIIIIIINLTSIFIQDKSRVWTAASQQQ